MKEIPILSVNLIEQLDKDEPVLTINPKMEKDEIMYKAGRRAIIDDLIYRLKYFENKEKANSIKL